MRFLLAVAFVPSVLTAQPGAAALRDRAAFATWLTTGARSPYAAVAFQPIGEGITVGGDSADLPLAGIGRVRLSETRGGVQLATPGSARAIPWRRDVPLGPYRLMVDGEPGRGVVIVYGALRDARPPAYFVYDAAFAVTGALTPPDRPDERRMLGQDGVETGATLAGTLAFTLGGRAHSLTVHRMAEPGSEESELVTYFKDASNEGGGSYPSGRFLVLEPAGDGRFIADFNRAANPFCAYRSVFPCPVPWPGNTLPIAVAAGERYEPLPRPSPRPTPSPR